MTEILVWTCEEEINVRWVDCVKNDMKEKGVSDITTVDRMEEGNVLRRPQVTWDKARKIMFKF